MQSFSARSWLFAPGDSPRKMAKAADGSADAVILDLEDAVAEEGKPGARAGVAEFLAGRPEAERGRLWVRINPLDGPHALSDLAAIVPARPGGVMLPKARGPQDVEVLDHYLSALEVAAGTERGAIRVIALVTETAEGMFTTGAYKGAPRLTALTWGAEDLADAVGASDNRGPDGGYGFTYELARSLCLLGAAAAGVAAVDTIHGDFRDLAGLRARAEKVRRDGYRGMLAIHPDQVEVINAAFAPTEAELAEAREIVELFAAHPGVGAIGRNGAMLDRPHLARARALLAAGGLT
ncbi:citrate lyase subunit beta/citryl-CoA lyase [Actinocorallia herbida]|uniref:Citrate lyase subunit beta/citryl-CoA lyase n=1 Tax=Actinocorallia herbida TaxID=58109 RepID=A0A3N1CV66_9ACTN|nr:CoA ester lyase [Actinocorallia herbida]ROO85200.1 citrate lyase subunit beta/citryl-CoA lyase [Actinocorallia herbida]